MIGGYIFKNEKKRILYRLENALGEMHERIPCGDAGFVFHDNPFSDFNTAVHSSENLTMLSQDMLVTANSDGSYSLLDLRNDLPDLFKEKKAGAFNDIVSDFCLIIIDRSNAEIEIYLVSNRAGNGRMYFSKIESGIIFSSDIKFLLKVLPFDVNDLGIYALLKYGAIP
jgi:hypothetical protein